MSCPFQWERGCSKTLGALICLWVLMQICLKSRIEQNSCIQLSYFDLSHAPPILGGASSPLLAPAPAKYQGLEN